MNPLTNKFEKLIEKDMPKALEDFAKALYDPQPLKLFRPNGKPVPEHWTILTVGEKAVIKNYTFMVKYIGETSILFEPVGPVIIGVNTEKK